MQTQMVSRFRNHYSETRFAAIGDPETTPKLDLLPARPWKANEKVPPNRNPSRPVSKTGREGPSGGLVYRLFIA